MDCADAALGGDADWGLNADYDALPDLDEMIAALRASFSELQKAAG